MSEGAVSSDRMQQARDNIASRRQSGLEPRPEDLRDAQLDRKRSEPDGDGSDERDDDER